MTIIISKQTHSPTTANTFKMKEADSALERLSLNSIKNAEMASCSQSSMHVVSFFDIEINNFHAD